MSNVVVRIHYMERTFEASVEKGSTVFDVLRKTGLKASSVIVFYKNRIIPLNAKLYDNAELVVENCIYRG